MEFIFGFLAATFIWFFLVRWNNHRIDCKIEAEMSILEKEKVDKIFETTIVK